MSIFVQKMFLKMSNFSKLYLIQKYQYLRKILNFSPISLFFKCQTKKTVIFQKMSSLSKNVYFSKTCLIIPEMSIFSKFCNFSKSPYFSNVTLKKTQKKSNFSKNVQFF